VIEILVGRHHMGNDYNFSRFFHFSVWFTFVAETCSLLRLGLGTEPLSLRCLAGILARAVETRGRSRRRDWPGATSPTCRRGHNGRSRRCPRGHHREECAPKCETGQARRLAAASDLAAKKDRPGTGRMSRLTGAWRFCIIPP